MKTKWPRKEMSCKCIHLLIILDYIINIEHTSTYSESDNVDSQNEHDFTRAVIVC